MSSTTDETSEEQSTYEVKGTVRFADGSPARDVQVSTFDRDLRSDNFLLVETHPDITFVSKRVEGVTPAGFKLVGDLTIRGVTKEVALEVEGPSKPVQRAVNAPPVIGATATTTINRKDFGVKYNALIEAGGAVVSDEVKITIDIEARKRAQ